MTSRLTFGAAALVALPIIASLGMWTSAAQAGHDPDEKLLFFDLRPAKEFQKRRLPGARSIPATELGKRYAEIPKSGRVILYCDCPWKEIDAACLFLQNKGYRNLGVMEEGFSGWIKRNYPVETHRPG